MPTTRQAVWLFSFLGIVLLPEAMAADPGEMVPNSTFSKGSGKQPEAWSKMDGITTRWDRKGGNPGACLKLDTSVLQVDVASAKVVARCLSCVWLQGGEEVTPGGCRIRRRCGIGERPF